MTSVRKFMFETDFDAPTGSGSGKGAPASEKSGFTKSKAAVKEAPAPIEPPPPPPPPPEPTFTVAEVKAAVDKARAEGQQAGEAKGRAAAMAETEQRIATALDAMLAQVTALQAQFASDRAAILGDATTLAMAVLRKMLPEYSRRGGMAEIETVLETCLRDQRREPRLVARIAPDLLPELEQHLAALSAKTAFEGKLFLIADDRLGPADCTVEWADGGTERHADAIWREISTALDRCLGLAGITPAPAPDSDGGTQKTSETETTAEAGFVDASDNQSGETETGENKSGPLAQASDAAVMRSE